MAPGIGHNGAPSELPQMDAMEWVLSVLTDQSWTYVERIITVCAVIVQDASTKEIRDATGVDDKHARRCKKRLLESPYMSIHPGEYTPPQSPRMRYKPCHPAFGGEVVLVGHVPLNLKNVLLKRQGNVIPIATGRAVSPGHDARPPQENPGIKPGTTRALVPEPGHNARDNPGMKPETPGIMPVTPGHEARHAGIVPGLDARNPGLMPGDNALSAKEKSPHTPLKENTTLLGKDSPSPQSTVVVVATSAARTLEVQCAELRQRLFGLDPRCEVLNRTSGGLEAYTEIAIWITQGCNVELDVVPTIEAKIKNYKSQSKRHGGIRSWGYFSDSVLEAKNRRLAGPAMRPSNGYGQSRANGTFRPSKDETHDALLELKRRKEARRQQGDFIDGSYKRIDT